MPARVKKKKPAQSERENVKKWGKVIAQSWTFVPSILLEKQTELGLTPRELNILLQLFRHWWKADAPPFPSHATIAEACGCDRSTVQRTLKRLEKRGLIETTHRTDAKHGGRTSNEYGFGGLIKEATYLAEEVAEERAQQSKRRKTTKKKLSKSRKGLRVVRE
ncbi:helix-turn-helix domain-containing protein [Crateriforma conspicua]|uniref:MarR family protein n=1 Tax=Crateriforma conspicua TaxID=2527996 RepID=A0A5C6FN97_9PLAN|nr:helix-turn-helix domain-containing protein [Crateriforma conspicua]TWU61976.1 MarR family protein [Crateriforma conspicua]